MGLSLKSLVGVVTGALVVAAVATGVGALVGSAALAAAGGAGAYFGSVFATTAVLGGLSAALAKKPGQPAIQARTITTRQAVAPQRIIYGQARVGGVVTFIWTDTIWINFIVTLAGHVCEEIGDIYLNDELVPIDPLTAGAIGKYAGYVWVRKSLGDEAGQPWSWLVTATGGIWTDAHRQTGRAKILVTLHKSPDLFPSGIPNITAVVKGRKIYDPRTATTVWSSNSALCVADYLTNTSFGMGADYATEIDETALIAAANICDQSITLKVGTGTGYVTSGAHSVGAVIIPLVSGTGTILVGDQITIASDFEPDGVTLNTYLISSALSGGVIVITPGLKTALTTGKAVTLVSPTTEPRYTANGAFTTDQAPKDTIAQLLSVMAGQAVSSGDRWYIHAGGWVAPSLTLTETDMAGTVSVQSLVSRRENCNGVKGVFVNPKNAWQACDFPPIASDTYMTEDGGQRIWKDLDLTAFCTSGSQAQRLAKIELLKTRQGLTVSAQCKLTAYKAMTGYPIGLTLSKFGWTAKAFDVVSSSFAISQDADGITLGVSLGLRETASAIYDWSTSEEQTGDIAPNTSLLDPWSATPPSGLALGTSIYDQRGLVGVLTWTAPDNPYVRKYAIRYRTTTGPGAWIDLDTVEVATTCQVPGLTDGVSYDFAVASVNSFGVRGTDTILTAVANLPAVPELSSAKVWSETDANGNATRVRVQVAFTDIATNRPDGVMIMYAHSAEENSLQAEPQFTTESDITLYGLNIFDSSTNAERYPSEWQLHVLPGSTATRLIVRDPTSPIVEVATPLPQNRDYPGHLWMNPGGNTEFPNGGTYQLVIDYDETSYYFESPGFPVLPDVGNIVRWVNAGFSDMRPAATAPYSEDSYRLLIFQVGAQYEIIRWDHFYYQSDPDQPYGYDGLHLVCSPTPGIGRGAEGTYALNSNTILPIGGQNVYYLPAPGPGTTIIDIPTSAFVTSDGGTTYTADVDAVLNFAAGEWISFSCCAYRRSDGGITRSYIRPMTYGGTL